MVKRYQFNRYLFIGFTLHHGLQTVEGVSGIIGKQDSANTGFT